MKKIKEEDLILYLYQECSPALQARIEQALEEDITLQDNLERLRRTLRQLDKLKLLSPSKQSLKAVMRHAQGNPGRKH
ncbi:anti-sigma factor [Sediminibacterium soli]|uniref:hypothetical protein n=1 Tax=Sediminibacterium soli TaxID=2698829 RepID=UPI00137A87EB|nr:hypothetical protein [Sediminibacterium soli]NCI47557.1 hypothetical protein [Sediminibacterium soli]